MWFLGVLVVLLSPLVVLAVVALARVSLFMVRYQWEKRHYKDVWRHPMFAPGIVEATSQTGGIAQIWDQMKSKDGKFVKVSNWGPYLDGKVLIVVSDRNAAQTIFQASEGDFPKDPFYEYLKILLGQGLVTSEGKVWREDRKLLTPFFHFKAVQEAFPISIESAQYLLQLIGDTNDWLPAKDTFATYSSKVIIKFAFGDSFDVKVINTQIKEILQTFNDYFMGKALFGSIWDFIPIKSGWGMSNLVKKFMNPIKGTIRNKRESQTEAKDLLTFLCQLRYEDGSMMPEQHVIEHCTTFLFAGEDTTACTLSWVMYYISLHPHIQEKLQAEVDQVLKDSLPTMETIHQLNFCNHVIKETLRIQPVVPYISRVANRDCEFSGVKVKKGTCVSFGIYPLHNDTAYWEKPEQFMPERWEDDSCKKSFLWIPFSAGQRNCLGQKFALQEILIVLAMIIQKYNIQHNHNKNVIPVWEGVLTPVNLELKFTSRK